MIKRLKDGKQTSIEFEDYLEKRAKIERTYAEEMLRLSRNVIGKDEIGSVKKSFEQLKAESENVGRLHMQLSQRIQEEVLKSTKEFRNQQKDVRKKREDTVKKAQTHKRNCYERNNRSRSTYENKCREADRAQETLHKLETNPLTKATQLTTAHKKMEVAKAASNTTDLQYQEAVKTLEDGRVLWEREMEILCQKYQELEEQRIAYLRHQMWTLTNYCSQTYVEDDEAYENVRKTLEKCNVDDDIDLFVREKCTGSDRPAPIPYENFYNPRNKASIPGVPTLGSAPPRKELPPLPIEDPTPATTTDSTYSSLADATNFSDDQYSVPRSTEARVVALYDYEAQGDQELELEEGDVVTVIGREDDVWWCGKHKDKMGMFPAAYVEPYTGQ